ncbi:MAG: alkaline phosphatase family protein [Gammaproteobacteria bacterium]|nr:alkaline phosphatase family protein [Gammaproteobacteria bacterium]MCP5424633.1 alkaline phosphatase family protein [Gammaproteobacteria bacterium]MCP5460044.1 alkaline phosphatase family protein [Gammaproteobacteria bacterium]
MASPDYHGGSLVNLMSSLACGLGGRDEIYQPLGLLPPSLVAEARHVVLLIFDGLGYHYLLRHGRALKPYLRGRITSVFPTSTAPAITTLLTGVAPQQHGVTGWFMNLRELGSVAVILPFRPRWGTVSFASSGFRVSDFIGAPPLTNGLDRQCHFLIHQDLQDSPYSQAGAGRAERHGYKDLAGYFDFIQALVRRSRKRSYLYAYWPLFDYLCHRDGVDSKTVEQHFQDIEHGFSLLTESLRGTQTLLLATADHGFIDTALRYKIRLDEHPELAACLSAPLCGEPRVAFCYVRASQTRCFERYVAEQLGHCCELYRSEDLLEAGWFGLGKPDPRVLDRCGDYTLVMKDRYVIKDTLPGEGFWSDVGVHGGISEEEMAVPLLAAFC